MFNNFHIIGCGYIGKKVAGILQSRQVPVICHVHSVQSKKQCDELGLNSSLLELDNTLNFDWSSVNKSTAIAYFAPPPPKGVIDSRMTHFLESLKNFSDDSGNLPGKIVLISTTGVYGDCHGEWIDENREVNPQADRAYRRLDAEKKLQSFCEQNNVDYIVFRVPGIYAADKLPIKRISSGEPIVRAEDSGYTNRVHADDLAAFCVEAMSEKIQPGIYNCCDGNPSTMNDYFMRVADALKIERPKEISMQQAKDELSAGMLSYLAESKRISNEKLRNHFETKFKYPDLKSGLQLK